MCWTWRYFLWPSKFQGSVPKPNSVGCYGQLNSSSLYKQTRKNPLGRDMLPLWKIMTWCHHYQITLKPDTPQGVWMWWLSRSNQVQSTEWSLHPQVFKQICLKWFTPHVNLFANRLNLKVPMYISPVPDQNSWDIDALNINWSGLTAYAYPLLHRVIQNKAIQLPDHCNSPRLARNALVLGPSAALNRDPTSTTSVTNSSLTIPQ